METFVAFFTSLAGLVPVVAVFASVIALVVDTAKRFGLKDGYAPALSAALNLAAYGIVYFATPDQAAQFPTVAAGILAVAPFVVALLASLLGSSAVHDALAGIGIGYSHTDAAKG